MKNATYSTMVMLSILTFGLFLTICYAFKEAEPHEDPIIPSNHKHHQYDYILEVNGDSIITYNLYDDQHKVVKEGFLASELDSIIIYDNQ